jgi:hypothetical protein
LLVTSVHPCNVDLDQVETNARQQSQPLLNDDAESMHLSCRLAASLAAVTAFALPSSEAGAGVLALFRYEHQAQRHCPADTVVWLDFKKGRYYFSHQKLYASGFHGSFVCLEEARRSHYRRSLLGRR